MIVGGHQSGKSIFILKCLLEMCKAEPGKVATLYCHEGSYRITYTKHEETNVATQTTKR